MNKKNIMLSVLVIVAVVVCGTLYVFKKMDGARIIDVVYKQ